MRQVNPHAGFDRLTLWSLGRVYEELRRGSTAILVHEIEIDALKRRETLLTGVLLGSQTRPVVEALASKTGRHWAKLLVDAIPDDAILRINKVLSEDFATKFSGAGGTVVLGAVTPLLIGAAIGGATNLVSAEAAIRFSRLAFAPTTLAGAGGDDEGEADEQAAGKLEDSESTVE